jgi:hypothetical protein
MLNTNTRFASGSEGKCWVKEPSAFALHRWASMPPAGRAASTAERFSTAQDPEACSRQRQHIEPSALHFHKPVRLPSLTSSVLQSRCLSSALRSRARQSDAGRAATSFARGGNVVMFASRATQHKMRAGISVLRPRSNPSVEGTNNGGPRFHASATSVAPLFAPHLKR